MWNNLYVLMDMNWGQNVKKWITDQASAIALAVVVIILIPLILKKQWANLIGTLVVGAIALYFVNSPETLQEIGRSLYGIITAGAK
jgi:hypothetical protein